MEILVPLFLITFALAFIFGSIARLFQFLFSPKAKPSANSQLNALYRQSTRGGHLQTTLMLERLLHSRTANIKKSAYEHGPALKREALNIQRKRDQAVLLLIKIDSQKQQILRLQDTIRKSRYSKSVLQISEVLNQHLTFYEECLDNDGNAPRSWPRPARTAYFLTSEPPWPLHEKEKLGDKK